MDQFVAELRKIPPVTRFLTGSSLAVTIPVLMNLVSGYRIPFVPRYIFPGLEFWRLHTSFFLGPGGINYVFELVMLYRTADQLESGPYAGRSSDLAWQLLFVGASIIGLTRPLNSMLFSRPLLVALAYLSSALAPPGAQTSLFGLVTLPIQYFPYIMIGMDLLMGGPAAAAQALAGAVAGHAWLWSVWGTSLGSAGPLAGYARAPNWLENWLDGPNRRPPQTGSTGAGGARMAAGGVHVVPPRSAEPSGSTSGYNWGRDFEFGQRVDATEEGREWLKGLEAGFESFDVSTTDPGKLYKVMIAGIVPRPIAFVSSISEDGVENLGLFRYASTSYTEIYNTDGGTSWFNQVSPNPPVISIACANYPTRLKDTARNIRTTKGFTVNIISHPFIQNANVCSIDTPPEISEWALSGLTKEPSVTVKAPRVKESAFVMECELLKTVDIVEPNSLRATSTLVLGLVKHFHIRKDILDPVHGLPDPGKLKPVARMGNVTFTGVSEGYQIPRPSWANEKDRIKEALREEAVTGKV
ncbi:hypothetical protein NP233_g10195 [Leucocoprinus birnbaumii]|uniref:Flavin reductase like domain-containing protein n=1 Tax=Leucocoprinus birnbaumii TaxID=56174 RepID=A0AAD5VJP6_9AGAR|nr:hypothetical protein NP233_g10195 [Leucocoprinus birnbaumii]